MADVTWGALTEEGKLEVYLRTGRGGSDSQPRCGICSCRLHNAAERRAGICGYHAEIMNRPD
jgi:hypothetical protein